MARSLTIMAGLLAAGLIWAYFLAHPIGARMEKSDRTVKVWEFPYKDIAELKYQRANTRFSLNPSWEGDREKPYVWIRTSVRHIELTPRGQKPPKTPPKPKTREEEFKGNDASHRVLQEFASLQASRALGPLKKLKGEEFGLPAPSHSISLRLNGRPEPVILEIGRTTYGNKNYFVHSSLDDEVYLLKQSKIRRIASTLKNLRDRSLFPFPLGEAEKVVIRNRQGEKPFWRIKNSRPRDIRWSFSSKGEEAHVLKNFMDKLQKLQLTQFDMTQPASSLGKPEFEAKLYQQGKGKEPAAWLRIYPASGPHVLAVSSHTERTVQLPANQVKKVLQEGNAIIKGS